LTWLGALAVALGCGSSHAPAPGPEAAAASPSATPGPAAPEPVPGGLPDRDWGDIESARFLVVVPVPERGGWVVDDRGPWLEASHPVSRSRLQLRTWRASRLVRPEECEKQARLWQPDLPEASAAAVLETRQLDAPDGYRTHLTVGVQQHAGDELEGFALAFGAAPGRCLALVYRTAASGRDAEQAVGNRLLVIADGALARMTARRVDDRARGQRPIR
jgi:hypothetical protein